MVELVLRLHQECLGIVKLVIRLDHVNQEDDQEKF